LTTGEICAHFAEIYGASVSKETISRITDKVLEEMNDWAHRPLDEVSGKAQPPHWSPIITGGSCRICSSSI